jgi:hypothetical protein
VFLEGNGPTELSRCEGFALPFLVAPALRDAWKTPETRVRAATWRWPADGLLGF